MKEQVHTCAHIFQFLLFDGLGSVAASFISQLCYPFLCNKANKNKWAWLSKTVICKKFCIGGIIGPLGLSFFLFLILRKRKGSTLGACLPYFCVMVAGKKI